MLQNKQIFKFIFSLHSLNASNLKNDEIIVDWLSVHMKTAKFCMNNWEPHYQDPDRPLIHTKMAHFWQAHFENGITSRGTLTRTF